MYDFDSKYINSKKTKIAKNAELLKKIKVLAQQKISIAEKEIREDLKLKIKWYYIGNFLMFYPNSLITKNDSF